MKKFTAILLAVLLISSLAACGNSKKTALVISGTETDSEIFTYYLDKVMGRPIEYDLPENPKKAELKEAAIVQCKKYLAANTSFRDMGLSLTSSEKVEIAQTVNDYWVRFENHYNSIGVSKQTLTKILTAKAYEEAVFAAKYDKGTANAKEEAVLQNYFYDNYISFRNVCAYFTSADGSTPLTQLEKNKLVESINLLAENAGTDIEKFGEAAQAAGYSLSDSVLLKKGAEGYPVGFFEKVAAQKDGTVQVITYDECIFIVWKENLREKGESVYANYRSVCISDLYADKAEAETDEYISSFTVEEKSIIDRIIKKFY
ncbi:MAG: hypothetical protein E7516_00125 [Ruminococcaceae bacterium]|nr:hypothetical protein [Oscillospiraceae bacterium]